MDVKKIIDRISEFRSTHPTIKKLHIQQMMQS